MMALFQSTLVSPPTETVYTSISIDLLFVRGQYSQNQYEDLQQYGVPGLLGPRAQL